MSDEQRLLNPVYVALENHQYKAALKHAQSLPPSSVIGRALLAHCYYKTNHPTLALNVLHQLLGFSELQLQLQYSAPGATTNNNNNNSSSTTSSTTLPSTSKRGKKNKKRAAPKTTATTANPKTISLSNDYVWPDDWDWIDRLDVAPTLSNNNNSNKRMEAPRSNTTAHLDATTLATLAMTLNGLNCVLCVHSLYVWASEQPNAIEQQQQQQDVLYLKKAFTSGLAVLLQDRYRSLHGTVYQTLQSVALKLKAKQQQVTIDPSCPASLWAATATVWNIHYRADKDDNPAVLKLAESLACQAYQEYQAVPTALETRNLLCMESFTVYLQTLTLQKKFTEQLTLLNALLSENGTNAAQQQQQQPFDGLDKQTLLEQKVSTCRQLEQYTDAVAVVRELLRDFPDDWEYWNMLLQVSLLEADGNVETACQTTRQCIDTILAEQQSPYPLRGPNLMRLELAKQCTSRDQLYEALTVYANQFAPRASSAYSDLERYVDCFLCKNSLAEAKTLVQFSESFRTNIPESTDVKERRKELCQYTFGVQLCFRIVSQYPELEENLPPWQDLVRVWKSFRDFEVLNGVGQEQKESRPPDELMLLAVQRLRYKSSSVQDRAIASCLLDAAIKYSPHNAFLKIESIFLNGELHAASRSWELYNELHVKHIQYESCSYLILPILRSGGHYREVVNVCRAILQFQRSSERDTAEYAGRAMERGSASKAKEFLDFQREKMRTSLSFVEAKGLILDSAPFINECDKAEIGLEHGIVGRETDFERAKQMSSEARNSGGAFSLLELRSNETADGFSDNRDSDLLSYQILERRYPEFPARILSESIRRGKVHGILIRAALCVEAIKGPKKGKVTAASAVLRKRCLSLLEAAKEANSLCSEQSLCSSGWLLVMIELTRMIPALGAGIDASGTDSYGNLEAREEACVLALGKAREALAAVAEKHAADNDCSVAVVSRMLSDSIAPAFALFSMCSRIADLFGWGPRKRETKRVSASVADFAALFANTIGDLRPCLEALSNEMLVSGSAVQQQVNKMIGSSSVNDSISSIQNSRGETRERVERFLNYVLLVLTTPV